MIKDVVMREFCETHPRRALPTTLKFPSAASEKFFLRDLSMVEGAVDRAPDELGRESSWFRHFAARPS
jgi:hypothetical protein